ncbi:eukaryotic translation initiation factor 3 subunit L-like [Paramacrobiotus metropolitanus]|uniref:eukaryotic translation initiation factor 3 subunit L-like n=1 Tax=Paramacrobiotus metropolitanus TaxID=2943436 RepID=UPI0024464052|nr:eukaryotic translation initiation factor 3 subunit L-like [Paramacrobiotus metropolitanus]
MYYQDNYEQRGGGRRGQQSFASVAGGNQGRYRDRNRDQGEGRYNQYNDDHYGGDGGGGRGGGGGRRQYRDNHQQHWEREREPLEINEDSDIPDEVHRFLHDLKEAVRNRETSKLQHLYEADFRGLSEIYYQTRAWPHPKVIESIIGDLPERIFILLYKELYFRHIYESSREGPSIDQRFDSYSNYWQIFDLILNRDVPLDVGLPNEWVWDMIDEFMYQFTHFSTYRAKADRIGEEELLMLKDNPMIWNVNIVMNIWLKLVEKSRIQEQLEIYNAGGDPTSKFESGSFADHPMYKMLGYYSLISLMRLHCLLGDYYSALKVLENVELGKKHLLQASGLQACLVATYYHVGVCYMMMRRYQDAIRTFCDLLLHQQRATTPMMNRGAGGGSLGLPSQFAGGRTYQVDTLGKTVDKMYNCLAVCLVLHPMHIDESISSSLRDKLGDRLNKVQKGADEDEFEKLLTAGLPKFITPVTNYDDIQPNSLKDFQMYQLSILKKEFSAQTMVGTIQSYLKLYTSMPVTKLARFVDLKEDDLLQHLYTYKHKMTNIVHNHGSPLNGELKCRPELDFYIDKDMIYIADTKVAPRYGDFFVRNIQKFEELTETLKMIKVGSKEG